MVNRKMTNVENRIINNFMRSKMKNKEDVLAIISKIPMETEFKAEDVKLYGATLSSFVDMGVLKVVGTEDCWYMIDDDTMKKGTRNIYKKTYDTSNFLSLITKATIDKKIEEVAKYRELYFEGLAELENLGIDVTKM